ncbi:hypothetical protein VPIG_00098 [Vibrio phage PWH3a-P1]|uniref:hypothetical protein n=1 Tax=Vibrio phage PWH3a-P1 TaxID=754058 RepID=UPI0002C12457|nr:hypothetical protein VPIG_00098 [Vibrio phage PWH3a-P1]AGH31956.1 hypothetical protein VPIG_00098 [Vibrio phage PWH3a-P1]
MKYKFKEGQWFDIRKLTDWQKQWCLDNLEWVSVNTKEKFTSGKYYITYVAKYEEYEITFIKCSLTDEYCVSPENEITFNDFYWGEEEDKRGRKLYQFSQEIDWKDYLPIKFFNNDSVFDKPRWVTVKHKAPALTQGKDYKVLGFNGSGNLQKIVVIDDEGKESSYHHSIFHKVTPQDLLPDECTDEDESFDNLVYVEPKSNNISQYFSLNKSSCSEEQWSYVIDKLGNRNDCLGNHETIQWCCDYKSWFDDCSNGEDTVIFFNHIFQEVKEH